MFSLLFLKKRQKLKLSSAANYRWRFISRGFNNLNLCNVHGIMTCKVSEARLLCKRPEVVKVP